MFHFTKHGKGRKRVSFPASQRSQAPQVIGVPSGLLLNYASQSPYFECVAWLVVRNRNTAPRLRGRNVGGYLSA